MKRTRRSLPLILALLWATLHAGCARVDPVWRGGGPPRPPEALPAGLEELRHQVRENPTSVELRVQLGNAYLALNMDSAAAAEYQRATGLDPQNVEALVGLAALALRGGSPSQSLQLVRQAVSLQKEKGEEDPRVLQALAVILAQGGRLDEAEAAFQEALSKHPKDPGLLRNAARLAASRRNFAQAEDYYRQAAAIEPDNLAPRVALAELHLRQGLNAKAIQELTPVLQRHPQAAQAHLLYGRALDAQDRTDEALRAFQRAIDLEPTWPTPYLAAGYVCQRMEDLDGALEYFDKALQLDPEGQYARLGRAQALKSQGIFDEATRTYEEMLGFNPEQWTVLNNLAYLYAQTGRDLERALELAERALELAPDQPNVRDTLGWVYHLRGEPQRALPHLETAARLAPDRGLYHYHVALALAALGRREEASGALRTAISKGLPPDTEAEARGLLGGGAR